jgi:hypothetical protein
VADGARGRGRATVRRRHRRLRLSNSQAAAPRPYSDGGAPSRRLEIEGQCVDGLQGKRKPKMGYGRSKAMDRFTYWSWIEVDFLDK